MGSFLRFLHKASYILLIEAKAYYKTVRYIYMKHMIIYDWAEVEHVLQSELESDPYSMSVKPCFLKKGFGVVSMEEVELFEGILEDMQEELKVLKGFINQNIEREERNVRSVDRHIEEARKEAQEAEERDFEAEKERMRRLLEEEERD